MRFNGNVCMYVCIYIYHVNTTGISWEYKGNIWEINGDLVVFLVMGDPRVTMDFRWFHRDV